MKKSKQFKLNNSTVVGGKKFNTKRLYDTYEWKEYSQRFLKENSRCYSCGKSSNVCDHIVAHKNKKELFEDTTNHLPLCIFCHNYITANFDRHGNPKTEEKLKWISLNRVNNSVAIPVKVLPYYKKD